MNHTIQVIYCDKNNHRISFIIIVKRSHRTRYYAQDRTKGRNEQKCRGVGRTALDSSRQYSSHKLSELMVHNKCLSILEHVMSVHASLISSQRLINMSRRQYVITFTHVYVCVCICASICMAVEQRDIVELHNARLERLIATQCCRLAVSLSVSNALYAY